MTSKQTIDLPIHTQSDSRWLAQKLESYFIKGGWSPPWVMQSRYETINFIMKNLGNLTYEEVDGSPLWLADPVVGQNIGDACLAAFYLASGCKGTVRFDANGTAFTISEIEKK